MESKLQPTSVVAERAAVVDAIATEIVRYLESVGGVVSVVSLHTHLVQHSLLAKGVTSLLKLQQWMCWMRGEVELCTMADRGGAPVAAVRLLSRPTPCPYAALLICPISKSLLMDPVTASDGVTYSRAHISAWISSFAPDAGGIISPITKAPFSSAALYPNLLIATLLDAHRTALANEEVFKLRSALVSEALPASPTRASPSPPSVAGASWPPRPIPRAIARADAEVEMEGVADAEAVAVAVAAAAEKKRAAAEASEKKLAAAEAAEKKLAKLAKRERKHKREKKQARKEKKEAAEKVAAERAAAKRERKAVRAAARAERETRRAAAAKSAEKEERRTQRKIAAAAAEAAEAAAVAAAAAAQERADGEAGQEWAALEGVPPPPDPEYMAEAAAVALGGGMMDGSGWVTEVEQEQWREQ